MVKNNRTNENDPRDAIKVKAQLAKSEAARMQVRESEEEEREGGHPGSQPSSQPSSQRD